MYSPLPHVFPSFVLFYQPFLCGYLLTFSLLKSSECIFLFLKSFSFLFFDTVNKLYLFINLFLSIICQKKGKLVWKSFQKPFNCQKRNFSGRFLILNIKCHIYSNPESCRTVLAACSGKSEFSASQVSAFSWGCCLDSRLLKMTFLITRIITEVLKIFRE